jgi:cytochrome c biogenesis protein CcmG, thiol:disulfide interchange protein DsbE
VNRWAAFAPLAVLALIVVISAFLLLRGGGPAPTVTAGAIGRPAPTYAMARLGGGALVSDGDTAGRAHVVNVFASWCVPCRAEHPQLMELDNDGAELVGVAYKDLPADTARYLDELGNPYHAVALDPDGRFGLQLGIAGVPETFVISASGRIVAVHRGPLTPEVVQREIAPALRAAR